MMQCSWQSFSSRSMAPGERDILVGRKEGLLIPASVNKHWFSDFWLLYLPIMMRILSSYLRPIASRSISHLCSSTQLPKPVTPLRLLLVHPDADTLLHISSALLKEGVVHIAVIGSVQNPRELLQAIYRAGVHDLHQFLFIKSLVSQIICFLELGA